MAKVEKIILWDFEGTLVDRPGRWRSALMEVLDVNETGHQVDMEQIRPYLRDGFPWHRPEEIHSELSESSRWWASLGPLFTRAYQGVGYPISRAEELSSYVREVFINPNRFIVYEDTIPTLTMLLEKGWRHAILSNHVPELQDIISGLDLGPYFDFYFSSGVTGYEKPNPKAFQHALQAIGLPRDVWMIGDNTDADIRGAESVGIRAILVRNNSKANVRYYAQDLREVVSIIETGE
jgi:putative hydrolase of the HAD superfamily